VGGLLCLLFNSGREIMPIHRCKNLSTMSNKYNIPPFFKSEIHGLKVSYKYIKDFIRVI
jgi:hypothetical protein